MGWPNWFPAGCPPQAAAQPAGIFYRIIKGDSPCAADFRASCVEKPERYSCEECRSCGVSIHDNVEAARRTLRRFRNLGTRVAAGRLDAQHGLVQKTDRDGHHDWWTPEGFDPSLSFSVSPE